MNPIDVLCLGDATIDIFLPLNKDDQNFKINEDFISFKLGDKFLADGYKLFLGGIACNVSVGISRLGKSTSLIAEVGNDELSETILKRLQNEKVNTELIVKNPSGQTTLSVIVSNHKDHILFVAHNPKEHNFELTTSSWLFLTGLGNKWETPYEKALNFAKENNIKIAFAPGISQIQEGQDKILNALGNSELLFVNKDEAQIILGENSDDIKSLLGSLKKLGPKIAVITDGMEGSFAVDNNLNFYHLGIVVTETVETTGAGDAYASGFLSSFIEDSNIEQSMKFGAINSSSVVEKIGAQEGLLTKNELLNRLNSLSLEVHRI